MLEVRFRRGSRPTQWGRRAPLYMLWEARPRAEAFSGTEPAPFAAGRGSHSGGVDGFFLWSRLTRHQPMVIRLALPPAAAVLMLSARSISSRSSGIAVSPGAIP